MTYHRPLNQSWWKHKLQTYSFVCVAVNGPLAENIDRIEFGDRTSIQTRTPKVRLWAFKTQEGRKAFMDKYGAKLL